MIVTMTLGAGVGLGLWLSWRAAFPRPESADSVLARLAAPAVVDRPMDHCKVDPGSVARRLLSGAGIDVSVNADALNIVGRSPERHALDKLIGAVAGLGVPLLVGLGLRSVGTALPLWLPVIGAVAFCGAGFVLPDLTLRDEVDRRRQAFRHALSSYLDLVNVLLAGGAGIETALHAAAEAGDGWGYTQIRQALSRARFTGRTPWEGFAELGNRLDISELAELAANVSLAGSHGARIRRSLAAKADTLRGHQIAETEASAESATERMTIPVAVLLFGFLFFIAYPAVQQITNVGGPTP